MAEMFLYEIFNCRDSILCCPVERSSTMKIFNSASEWKIFRKTLFFHGKTIGFVPTMGSLHSGHESLLRRSINENDLTVLSIFVNPTQFNNQQDFQNYPNTFEADCRMAHNLGVDFILVPTYEQCYPDNFNYEIHEKEISVDLEGKYRPGHFVGVMTVVMKLFNIVRPTKAYFGEKDFQQLHLIKGMVEAFFMDIEVIACETIRAENGLALSSRNSNLTEQHRELAPNFYRLLKSTLSRDKVIGELNSLGFKVDYIEEKYGRRFGAVHLGNVRLIDNMEIDNL